MKHNFNAELLSFRPDTVQPDKPKRTHRRFSDVQVDYLNQRFARNTHPDFVELETIAKNLDETQQRIKV